MSSPRAKSRPDPPRPGLTTPIPEVRARSAFCLMHLPCLVLPRPSFTPSLSLSPVRSRDSQQVMSWGAVPLYRMAPAWGSQRLSRKIHWTLTSIWLSLPCRPGDPGQMGGACGTQKHSARHTYSYSCYYFYGEKEIKEKARAEAQSSLHQTLACPASWRAPVPFSLQGTDRDPIPPASMFPTLGSPRTQVVRSCSGSVDSESLGLCPTSFPKLGPS